MDKEIAAIMDTLIEFKIAPFIFVDHYKFDLSEERQMMQKAMAEMDKCDLLLAETSEKGIGIGIEVGYATAKGKPVIYLRQQDAEHSSTVSGISDFQIIYLDIIELKKKLADILREIEVT
jgi:nucleoside 2-deoxyribosyltransferase